MKTSIPKIRSITPKKFEFSEVRQHLSRAIDSAFSDSGNPVVGFGLVMFHADSDHTASWHQTNLKTHGIDFCEIVRNRLKHSITKKAMGVD